MNKFRFYSRLLWDRRVHFLLSSVSKLTWALNESAVTTKACFLFTSSLFWLRMLVLKIEEDPRVLSESVFPPICGALSQRVQCKGSCLFVSTLALYPWLTPIVATSKVYPRCTEPALSFHPLTQSLRLESSLLFWATPASWTCYAGKTTARRPPFPPPPCLIVKHHCWLSGSSRPQVRCRVPSTNKRRPAH